LPPTLDPPVDSLWHLVGEHIPNDHSRQVHSQDYLRETMSAPDAPALMVDLGCGNGSSAAFARKYKNDVRWVGIDILQRDYAKKIANEQVLLYDGVNLPFADGSVPLIYSNQVFEHVRHPEPLLREILRVLQPGGMFIGGTSQLEPYHARSLWNYTVYGFKVLVEDAGLILEEIRPGIDGISLVQRQWFGRRPEHSAWFKISPHNREIDEWGVASRRRPALVNLRKLQFAGHFSFRVRKPGGEHRPPSGAAVNGGADRAAASARVAPMEPLGSRPYAPLLAWRQTSRRKVGRVVRWARRQARRIQC